MKVFFAAFLTIGLMISSAWPMHAANAAPGASLEAATIAAADLNSFAIQSDGSLWSWGFSVGGMLGDGSDNTRQFPGKILDNVAQVAAGLHSMAIKTDGSLWAWGSNWNGQIGDGTTETRYTPVRIMEDVIQVSVGFSHTMAITSDNSLWAWGNNEYGQLGNHTVMDRHTPVKIMENVVQVSAGESHTMAIRTDGSLYAWGMNNAGQLGIYTDTWMWDANSTPVRVMENVAQVSAGRQHTMAIKTDGGLYSWGNNWTGQLGDGSVTDETGPSGRYTPVRIMDNVAQVSAARGDFSVAITTEGYLYAWGVNTLGQVGDGTTKPWEYPFTEPPGRLSPVKIMSDVAYVSAGGNHTLAIRTDGSLWGWGDNGVGQLGDGTRNDRLSPVLIMHDVKLPGGIAAGSAAPILPATAGEPGQMTGTPNGDGGQIVPPDIPTYDGGAVRHPISQLSEPAPSRQWGEYAFFAFIALAGVLILLLIVLLISYKTRRQGSKTRLHSSKSGEGKIAENRHREILNALNASAGMVSDLGIAAKIKHVESLAFKIFCHVEEYPHKKPQIRKIVEYYLPAAIKMIRSYAAIEKQGIKSASLVTAQKTIGRSLDTLASGFERQFDLMFESDLVDLSSDEDVIGNMLRRDGLIGTSPFSFAPGK